MRRIMWAVLCLAIPGLLFLNAWQGFRYNDLSDKVAALEKEQKDLLEKNRDAIAQIAYETSPERVGQKAALVEGLVPLDQSAVTRLQVDAAGQGESAR
jgi:hypothetical protein